MRNPFKGWRCSKFVELGAIVFMVGIAADHFLRDYSEQLQALQPWRSLADQRTWGYVILTVALTHMVGLILNGHFRWSCILRAASACAHASVAFTFAWVFFDAGLYRASWTYAFVTGAVVLGALRSIEATAAEISAWKRSRHS